MAYDRKTHTITVGKESDFLVDSGIAFIDELKIDSQHRNATPSLVNDWKIIEEWLGCSGRELNNEDNDKIGKAWRAYLAIGLAPSERLQPVFTHLSNQYRKDGRSYQLDKPPTKVMDVFDRLLARDDEIEKKRKHDLSSERKKLESILNKSGMPKRGISWWRNRRKGFRKWAFGSVVWIVLVLLFVVVFDPFNNGAWRYMDDEEYLKMFFVMAIPLLAGGIKYAYDRIVK